MLKAVFNGMIPSRNSIATFLNGISDDWIFALCVSCGFFIVTLLLRHFLVKRLQSRNRDGKARFSGTISEVISEINTYILVALSLILGAQMLVLPDRYGKLVAHILFITLALQVGLLTHRVVAIWKRDHLAKRAGANSVMVTLIPSFLYALVWIVVILAILENDGVNITALVASLGIGGVALALAVQTILSDLFAAISIGVDKPFQVGDSITAGDTTGTVERIGLKSTRIRSVSGELIVCSNTDLLKKTIQNFERMTERRVVFRVNLHYHTSVNVAEEIPKIMQAIVEAEDSVRFARAHLSKLERSSLEFEVVYFVLNADYLTYMNIQQTINLSILRHLSELAVDFALPDGSRATPYNLLSGDERRSPTRQDRRVHH